jgi:hypothetical protein
MDARDSLWRARACLATYVGFGAMAVFVVGLSAAVVVKTGRGWREILFATLCGGLLLLWVAAFRLEIHRGWLRYRTLFGGESEILLSDIAKAEIEIGAKNAFGPFYKLVIYPESQNLKPIVVNMKIFSMKDLHHLFDELGPKLAGKRRFSVFSPK